LYSAKSILKEYKFRATSLKSQNKADSWVRDLPCQ
jgi:hypothetical protein